MTGVHGATIGGYREFWDVEPDVREGGCSMWLHRTQNMVTAHVAGAAGAVVRRADNLDEYFVWALFDPLVVRASGVEEPVAAGSVVIMPPGSSEVEFAGKGGSCWLGLTSAAADLLALCPNRDEYEPPLANVAPIEPWPEPPDGYRIRVYRLDDVPAGRPHCYTHCTGMTNLAWPVRTSPRASDSLSPHTHPDFEQASLIHSGTVVHHMRRAWGRDGTQWMPDEHRVLVAPAVAISKPPDVHTTQAMSNSEAVGLIDFFAPPRWDFSQVESMVVNQAEYPPPAVEPASPAQQDSVYAADDPRRATERARP